MNREWTGLKQWLLIFLVPLQPSQRPGSSPHFMLLSHQGPPRPHPRSPSHLLNFHTLCTWTQPYGRIPLQPPSHHLFDICLYVTTIPGTPVPPSLPSTTPGNHEVLTILCLLKFHSQFQLSHSFPGSSTAPPTLWCLSLHSCRSPIHTHMH